MAVICTYDDLTLLGSEITNFSFSREFTIAKLATIGLTEITQPGILTPIEFKIDSVISIGASGKFQNWSNKILTKPLKGLTFLNRTWGLYYLTSVDFKSVEFAKDGDILRMDMSISLLSNQSFG